MGIEVKLLIGSRMRHPGWTTLDLVPGPEADYIGDCEKLAQFGANSIEVIYASHVLEHVPSQTSPRRLRNGTAC